MRFSHFAAMTLIGALHLIIPLVLILWTIGRSYTSAIAWGAQILALVFYAAFIFLMGAWVYASFYLRYAITGLAIATALWSLIRVRGLPLFIRPHFSEWMGYGASIHKGARTNLSMRYAVDITKVTRWGNDAEGFLPMHNERYAVFNQVVYSPCRCLLQSFDKGHNCQHS
jgi:hypothetical protein